MKRRVVARLEEGDRGDRGWFLITRVHLTAARLRDAATYLHNVRAAEGRNLSNDDYNALAHAVGITGTNPGIQLRRHHLLAMEKPLRLLRRTDGQRWRRIQLTEAGIALATNPDTSAVLEEVLHEIVFCREPWYLAGRVRKYREFEIHPYPTTLEVLEACDGWVDMDEYDLFLSRLRSKSKIRWAVDGIKKFRDLDPGDRSVPLAEVRDRVPSAKSYRNWRDMALHTFTLFGLGRSAIREGQRLLSAERFITTVDEVKETILRIPDPGSAAALAVPPSAPAQNPGTEGELLVGKLLEADGWEVAFYTNRRGFGFDIWAHRGESAIVVEVKSSLGTAGSITFTELEHQAATEYGENYILAIVERLEEEAPKVYFITNPAGVLDMQPRNTKEYYIRRSVWEAAAHEE